MEKYIVDFVLGAIFILITLKYFKRGFTNTLLRFAAFLMSIVLAKGFSAQITDWIFANTRLFIGTEKYIAKLIIMVVTFLILSVVLNWIAALIDKVFKLPVLKQANKLLGGIFGAVNGAIIVLVLCIALQISSHVVYNSKYIGMVENSVIVQTVLSDEKIAGHIEAQK